MGQKNLKGTVSINKADGRIRLRWRYQNKRYSLNLSHYNRANLSQAKKVSLQIDNDISNACFDYTLCRYKKLQENEHPKTSTPSPTIGKKGESNCTVINNPIVQYFEHWAKLYRQIDFEKNIHYNALRNNLKKWTDIVESNALLKLNGENIGAKTYNERLTMLKIFCKWLVKSEIWTYNPFEDVGRKKVKKAVNPARKPFTEDEIKKILAAFKEDTFNHKSSRYTHSHYYPFIYFISKTGVRPAEAIGLRVSNISITNKTITIKEVMARSLKGTNAAQRVRKETKNGKERTLPLTPDLEIVLYSLILERGDDSLVFLSAKGLPIDDKMFQRRIFKPILKALNIEERVLYAYRHTFNSRCIDSGMTPVATAFLLGNNPETALRNYTHQISVPTELPDI